MKRVNAFLLYLLAAILLFNIGSAGYGCPMDLVRITARVKKLQLSLGVAATPETRRCGLSGRDTLPENEGVLFVLPLPRPFFFWMKDTRLPLSIAFIDDGGRILSIARMTPMDDEKVYQSPGPVRFAVEMNQGWFEVHGVHIGDVIDFSLPVGLDIR